MSFRFRSNDRQSLEEDDPLSKVDCQTRLISFPLAGLETLSDEDLVAQLVAGKHDALTVLVGRYSGMVFSIARRALKDNGEAEETVQQVFLDIYKAANQFDRDKASFKTWLLQFAYHRAINRKKHLAAKGFYTTEELVEELLPIAVYLGAGQTLQLAAPEFRFLIDQLLKTIQPRQRQTIEMTFFDGLTAEEISRQTGETPAVVRHNLYRGLSKLRTILLENEQVRKKIKVKDAIEGVSFAFTRPL
jgi:RNA polymerase sigma-70 factor, ECF subfamily